MIFTCLGSRRPESTSRLLTWGLVSAPVRRRSALPQSSPCGPLYVAVTIEQVPQGGKKDVALPRISDVRVFKPTATKAVVRGGKPVLRTGPPSITLGSPDHKGSIATAVTPVK